MTYSMAMTTETKAILLGSFSGAVITSALYAFDWWIVLYTDSDSGGGFLGTSQDWAPLAAILGGALGCLVGAMLGFLLSLRTHTPLFAALAGALEGLAVIVILLAPKGFSTGNPRLDLMCAAFVPIGAISGFLTSLILSAVRKQR